MLIEGHQCLLFDFFGFDEWKSGADLGFRSGSMS